MSFLAGLAHEFRSECTQGECLLDSFACLLGEVSVRMRCGHDCRIGHFIGAGPSSVDSTGTGGSTGGDLPALTGCAHGSD
jgi:hypothetical protein